MSSSLHRIVAHITGWILFLALVAGFLSGTDAFGTPIETMIFRLGQFALYFIFIFYFNTALLIPKLYLQRKHALYLAALLLLFLLTFYLQPFEQLFMQRLQDGAPPPGVPGPSPPPRDFTPPGRNIDIISLIVFMVVISIGIALELMRQWQITEKKAARAEADKANAELSFLKAQINPHFLFNTLNNIYSMSVAGDEKTPEAILRLSNMLRYVTDEIQQDFVPLRMEVDAANDFIQLQKLRLSPKVRVHFTVDGDLESCSIAPLLFITFIENVFKYGVSSHEASVIEMRISAAGSKLRFFSRNANYSARNTLERKGIGIENARKRLEHLYPGKHQLSIDSNEDFFTVNLILEECRSNVSR